MTERASSTSSQVEMSALVEHSAPVRQMSALRQKQRYDVDLHRARCRSKKRATSSWYSLVSGAVMSIIYCRCD